MLIASLSTGGVYQYFHQDHLGSTRLTTNAAGAQAFSATYEPFGKLFQCTGTNCPQDPRFRFAGEWQDHSTAGDLSYNFARFYSPDLGRFISEDPSLGSLTSPQTLNRYPYVANNPLKYTDPSGTLAHVAAILIFILVTAVIFGTVAVVAYAYHTPRDKWTWEGAGRAFVLGFIAGAAFAAAFALACLPCFQVGGGATLGMILGASFIAGIFSYNVDSVAEWGLRGFGGTPRWKPEEMVMAGVVAAATALVFYVVAKGILSFFARERFASVEEFGTPSDFAARYGPGRPVGNKGSLEWDIGPMKVRYDPGHPHTRLGPPAPRHVDPHYHVYFGTQKVLPPGYTRGEGTGFLPHEAIPWEVMPRI